MNGLGVRDQAILALAILAAFLVLFLVAIELTGRGLGLPEVSSELQAEVVSTSQTVPSAAASADDVVEMTLGRPNRRLLAYCQLPRTMSDPMVVTFTLNSDQPDDFVIEVEVIDQEGETHRGLASVRQLRPGETRSAVVVATAGEANRPTGCNITAIQRANQVLLFGSSR